MFERFVAAFLRRYVLQRLPEIEILPHAGRHKVQMDCEGQGVLPPEPNLLVDGPDGRRLVMDAKWKLLAPSWRGRGGVTEADLCQL